MFAFSPGLLENFLQAAMIVRKNVWHKLLYNFIQTFLSILSSSGLAFTKVEKAANVTEVFESCDSIHLTPIRSRSTSCVKLANDGGSRHIALSARCNTVNSLCSGNTSGSSSSPVWLAYSSWSRALEKIHAGSLNNGLPERTRTWRVFKTSAKSSGSDTNLLKDKLRNSSEPHLPMPGGSVCSWLWANVNDDNDGK